MKSFKEYIKESGLGKLIDRSEVEDTSNYDFSEKMAQRVKPDNDTLPGYTDPRSKGPISPNEIITKRNTNTPEIDPMEPKQSKPAPTIGRIPK